MIWVELCAYLARAPAPQRMRDDCLTTLTLAQVRIAPFWGQFQRVGMEVLGSGVPSEEREWVETQVCGWSMKHARGLDSVLITWELKNPRKTEVQGGVKGLQQGQWPLPAIKRPSTPGKKDLVAYISRDTATSNYCYFQVAATLGQLAELLKVMEKPGQNLGWLKKSFIEAAVYIL